MGRKMGADFSGVRFHTGKTYGGGFTFSYRYKTLLFREQLTLTTL